MWPPNLECAEPHGEHMSFLALVLLFTALVCEDTRVNTLDSIVDEMDTRTFVVAH